MADHSDQEARVDSPSAAASLDSRADEKEEATAASDGLGTYATARYRHARDAIEAMDGERFDHALFGLLLSTESERDEMRAYEEQTSRLLRLAQTGHFVRQIQRLNGVLDAMSAQYELDGPASLHEWESALEEERSARVEQYDCVLTSLLTTGDADNVLLSEIESEDQQEEALTVLKAAVDKYGDDVLTSEEVRITQVAFQVVAQRSNVVVVSLPSWLVMPFEFSSSFGLSRWGNDVLFPNVSDNASFIQQANVWSRLNHPHVAKFLGACHVGRRPFIVHERVRTLSEYVSEVKDRRQVWRRLYEITLALQYLHERRVSYGGHLSLENAFCAEFEAKAMLFGVGLISWDEQHGDRSLQVAADVDALRALIMNCLGVASTPSSSNLIQRQQDNNSGLEDTVGLSSIPTSRPDFVNDKEWPVLSSIRQIDANSTGAILHIIEHLKGLSRVEQLDAFDSFDDYDDYDSVLELPKDAIEIGSVVVPALGIPVQDALSKCSKMAENDEPSTQIQRRLADIYAQLEAMDLTGDDESHIKELVEHFVSLLVRHHRSLEQQSFLDIDFGFSGMAEKKPASVFSFHMDIDRFMEWYSLSQSSATHAWKPMWELLCSKHELEPLSALLYRQSLLPGRHSCSQASHTDTSSSDTMLSEGTEGTGSPLTRSKLPNWFLPPSEVAFESFTEFSRGSFGSVHYGKWFETPVVVKRVFTDPANPENTQLEFLREADTWFQLNHINVVKMYGACHLDRPFFVCEYASGGNLSVNFRGKNHEPYLVWYSLLNAALGLQYLHDKGIVHADLKANNILVGADGIAKLADFGLSVSTRHVTADGNGGGSLGAYRWKAPECIPWRGASGKMATFASDVYSFAMVIIEVATGRYPWGMMDDQAVKARVKKGELPSQPAEIPDLEWQLIERMCRLNPEDRVTMDAVVPHLSSLLERLDLDRLSITNGEPVVHEHKNHVTSRGGALLSLIGLAKSRNKRLAGYAADHLIAVQVDRGTRSDKREIEAVIGLTAHGSHAEKSWAAQALSNISINDENKVLIASSGAIPPLVALVRDGNDVQKENATGALRNLSVNAENMVLIASSGAIPPLVALVCDGNDVQKENAAAALSNLSMNAENNVQIASSGAIPPLVALLCDGNDYMKAIAAGALVNMSVNAENNVRIASSGAIPALVALVRDGNAVQKENAARALSNLSVNTENQALIASSSAIRSLVALVHEGNDVQKENAAGALWNLSVNAVNNVLIASSGAISPLVALICYGNDVQKNAAAGALSNLSMNPEINVLIASSNAIPPLVALVRDGNDFQKVNAAAALANISVNTENKVLIASSGAIPPLVALVRDGNDVQKENAACALSNLAIHDDNMVLIASSGAIPPLVALVRDGNDVQKENAARALWNLSVNADKKVLIASSGAIPPLVALVRDGNDVQKEKAAGALWNLAYENVPVAALIVTSGGVEVLRRLIVDGTEGQKLRAVGALSFIMPDTDTKTLIVKYGGIEALVKYIQDSQDDGDTTEGLVALGNLCSSSDDVVHASLAAANGITVLSELARTGIEKHQKLACAILSDMARWQ